MAGSLPAWNKTIEMAKILEIKEVGEIVQQIRKENKSIVVAGGCFDILHEGHKKYLSGSKACGDYLFVLLESDKDIKRRKGVGRPINNQHERAYNLSLFTFIDFIVNLKNMTFDSDYDKLLSQINPEVISATRGEKGLKHKKRQAKLFNSKLVIIDKIKGLSTTNILKKHELIGNNTI